MSTENTLPYDGPLSTFQEWDCFLYGVVFGLVLSIDTVRRDLRAEPSKAIAGALLAYAISKLT